LRVGLDWPKYLTESLTFQYKMLLYIQTIEKRHQTVFHTAVGTALLILVLPVQFRQHLQIDRSPVQRMVKPQKITMKLNSYVKIDASGNTPIRVLPDLTDTTFKAGNYDFEI